MQAANEIIFSVSRDYSRTPGPRNITEGEFSGEDFRVKHLAPQMRRAIAENKILLLDLDGTAGYGPSFLEESIGGLIRIEKIPPQDVRDHLRFKSNEEPYLIDEIAKDLQDAADEI